MNFNYAELLIIRDALHYLKSDIQRSNVDRTSAERLWQKFDAEITKNIGDIGD
jgi:hypothetical protein